MSQERLWEQLGELEGQWRRLGAPVASQAAPGLSLEQIEAAVGPVGVHLPGELVVWWQWHNGVRSPGSHGFTESMIGTAAWDLLSLDDAVGAYRREPRSPQYPGDPIAREFYWRDTWFPFAACGADLLFVDTAAARADGTVPVRCKLNFGWEDWDVEQAASLADAVAMWVRALREGYYWWDPQAEDWKDRVADLPPEMRNHLIR